MVTLDKTMSASSVDILGGLCLAGRMCLALKMRGSSFQVHREDLTLKFLQIRVARWCYCLIFFVVTYSYPNCKVLYEERLISSHIFIPGHHPPTWPLLYQSWERQVLDEMWRIQAITWKTVKKIVQLKHCFIRKCNQSPNMSALLY